MVSIIKEKGHWILRAYLKSSYISVKSNESRSSLPSSVMCFNGGPVQQIPREGNGHWTIKTTGSAYCEWAMPGDVLVR